MFIRIVRIQVKAGHQAEFRQYVELLTLPRMVHRAGMLSFYPGQLASQDGDEFVLVTLWRDAAAERLHSGKDWVEAMIPAELMPLVKNISVHAYEGFGLPGGNAFPLAPAPSQTA